MCVTWHHQSWLWMRVFVFLRMNDVSALNKEHRKVHSVTLIDSRWHIDNLPSGIEHACKQLVVWTLHHVNHGKHVGSSVWGSVFMPLDDLGYPWLQHELHSLTLECAYGSKPHCSSYGGAQRAEQEWRDCMVLWNTQKCAHNSIHDSLMAHQLSIVDPTLNFGEFYILVRCASSLDQRPSLLCTRPVGDVIA